MAGQEAVKAAFMAEHNRRLEASKAVMNAYALEMGNWMRQNAQWTDRTANARNSLEALTEFGDTVLRIVAKGGGPPDYVEYLELSHAGKYAVIRPCIEQFSGRIYKDLRQIWTGGA